MSRFQVVPIPSQTAAHIRGCAASHDPTVLRRVVNAPLGYPCRRCLRDGEIGETMLLASHSPFDTTGPYAETGPIFVHERVCDAPTLAMNELPQVTCVRERVVYRAYDGAGAIHHSSLVDVADAVAALQTYFDDAAVAFVHARAVTNGCFTYAVVRV